MAILAYLKCIEDGITYVGAIGRLYFDGISGYEPPRMSAEVRYAATVGFGMAETAQQEIEGTLPHQSHAVNS